MDSSKSTQGKGFLFKLYEMEPTYQPYFIGFMILMFFLLPGIVILSLKKIRKIKNPRTNNSYCVISLYMLYATIFSAIMNFISNAVILFLYVYPPEEVW